MGINHIYLDIVIRCFLIIKFLFQVSLSMIIGAILNIIKLFCLDWMITDYITLCKKQKHIDISINSHNVVETVQRGDKCE
ncbi:transposase [Acinetobacter guillouiae]|uniref:transposase n=1 Tax=Acinetobacter guillouiae TaxID=106649 RepID=UPI003AF861FA